MSERLRLWLIRKLMPRGYQLARRLVQGIPAKVCPYCGMPWGPDYHDYVPGIGYEGCREQR